MACCWLLPISGSGNCRLFSFVSFLYGTIVRQLLAKYPLIKPECPERKLQRSVACLDYPRIGSFSNVFVVLALGDCLLCEEAYDEKAYGEKAYGEEAYGEEAYTLHMTHP